MLLSPSLLPQNDAKCYEIRVAGGEDVWVETGLMKECWKGQFLPSSALPGQSRPWGGLWGRGTIAPCACSALRNKPLVSDGTSR